jgi:HTH-type transcriptional regulator / antitoxin HigA
VSSYCLGFAFLRKNDINQKMNESKPFRTPGQLILSLMEERGWNKRTLAIVLGLSDATVTRITGDKQPVDARLSITLEELFNVPAERFLSLQKEFDLAQARIVAQPDPTRATRALLFGDLPVGEMIERGWLKAESQRDIVTVERELMRFFGVNRLEDIQVLPHAARKMNATTTATPPQIAWLYRVRAIAENMLVPKYSADKLRASLPHLRECMIAPAASKGVSRILQQCGIRFLLVETLKSAKIDGVCCWLDNTSPVISLSMRYDRIDNFWFVLRHEIEHVLQEHGKTTANIDAELEGERAGTGQSVPEEERIANGAAADFCVPKSKMDAFIARKAPLFSDSDLRGFAKILRVHPGIVAGQLQHNTGRFHIFRSHLASIRANVLSGAIVDGWGTVAPLGN